MPGKHTFFLQVEARQVLLFFVLLFWVRSRDDYTSGRPWQAELLKFLLP